MQKLYDVIIIGGGAAGLMCAIESGKRGRKTLLLEGRKNIGEKIRISGGGRCNFTNMDVKPDNYLSENPAFAISALKRFTQNDFIDLVKKHNIAYHHKTLGQLFCDISSKQIIEMLVKECEENKVEIKLSSLIDSNSESVSKIDDEFIVKTQTEKFKAKNLVVACGGLSIAKIGATDLGYHIARKFGIKIIETNPALVPYTFDQDLLSQTKKLAGVSVFAEVTCAKKSFREALLFTHKGLSGPVILQISSYWQAGKEIKINLAPEKDIYAWFLANREENAKQDINNLLNSILPKSLANFLVQRNNVEGYLADLSNKKLKILAENINNWQISPDSTEGYAKAEVTIGGVDCDQVSAKTFESKKVSNLYFIGEILDVTGHLGGYNFQWAWSSGFAAGQYV